MNEIFAPFREQAQTPAGRDAAWAWLQAHYAELSARLGPHVSGYLPYAASGQCTDGAAEEARAFFAPRMEATQGGPRNLAKVVEGIQICAASRKPSAVRALGKRPSQSGFSSSHRATASTSVIWKLRAGL